MDAPDSQPLFVAAQLLLLLISCVSALAIECAVVYALYFLITLPMRRNERTRIFLDCLELGLNEGKTPETAIIDAANSRDPSLGARFHLLAAHLQNGSRLGAGLGKVRRLLPPQVTAMLEAGERIGDAAKVLPACRRLVGDGTSQTRGALNYLLILALVVSPAAIIVPLMLFVLVIPKFKEVFSGMMDGAQLPVFTVAFLESSRIIMAVQIAVIAFTWLLMFSYIGGPRFYGWSRRLLPGIPDWIHFHLPWRRKRLQRDFSAMLAVLLDSGVPESEAVVLAGECTANSIVRRRVDNIRARLSSGVKLPDAIRALDDSGELQWRLANALRRGRDFLSALAGWHESLDAKAFQQEQAAAQLTTTALVLFNGAIVACVFIGMFLPLISLIQAMTLW